MAIKKMTSRLKEGREYLEKRLKELNKQYRLIFTEKFSKLILYVENCDVSVLLSIHYSGLKTEYKEEVKNNNILHIKSNSSFINYVKLK